MTRDQAFREARVLVEEAARAAKDTGPGRASFARDIEVVLARLSLVDSARHMAPASPALARLAELAEGTDDATLLRGVAVHAERTGREEARDLLAALLRAGEAARRRPGHGAEVTPGAEEEYGLLCESLERAIAGVGPARIEVPPPPARQSNLLLPLGLLLSHVAIFGVATLFGGELMRRDMAGRVEAAELRAAERVSALENALRAALDARNPGRDGEESR